MASLTMTAAPATRPTPLVGFGSDDLQGEADVGSSATPRHTAAGVPYERYETPTTASVPLAPLSLSARDLDLLSSSYSSPSESAPAAPDPPVASPTASTMGAADEAGIGIVGCGAVPNALDTTVTTTAASPPPAPPLSSPSAAILFGTAALPNAGNASGGIIRNDSSGSEDVEVRLAKTPPRTNAGNANPFSRGLSSAAVLGGANASQRSQQQPQQMVHAIPKHSSTPAGVASVGVSEMACPGDSPNRVGINVGAGTAAAAESKPKKSFRKRLGLGGGGAGRRKGDEGSGGRTSKLAAEVLGGEDGGHRLSPPPPPVHSMDPSPPQGSRASAVGSGVGSVASGVSTKSGRGRIRSPVPALLRKRSTDTNESHGAHGAAKVAGVERAPPPVQAQPKALSQSQQNHHRASAGGKPRPLHKRAVSSSGDSVTVGSLETIKASNVQRAASLAARRQRRTPAGVAAPPASALEKMEETAGGSALMGSAGKAASVNAADVDSGKGVHEKGMSQKPLKGLKRSIKKAFGLGRGVSSGSNSHESHKSSKSGGGGKGEPVNAGNSGAVAAGINAAKATNAAAATAGAGRGQRGNMHRAASTRDGLRPHRQQVPSGNSGEVVGNRRRLGSEPVVSTSSAAGRPHSSDHARPTTTKPASESARPAKPKSSQPHQAQAQWGRQPTHDELMNDAAIRGRLDGLDSISLGSAPASSLAVSSSSSSPVTAPPPMATGSKYSSSAKHSDGGSKGSSSSDAKIGHPSPGPSFFFQAESGVLYTPKDMVDDMLRRSGGKDPPEIVLEGYLPLGEDRWTVRIEKLPDNEIGEGGKDGKKKERAKKSGRRKKRRHEKKAGRGRRTGPVDLDEEGPVDLDAEPAGPIDLDEVMDQDAAAAEEEAASSSPLACGPLLALHSKGSSGSGSRPGNTPDAASAGTKTARAEEGTSDPNLKGSTNSATSAPCDGETVSTSASTTELMSSASSDNSGKSSKSPSEKAKAAAASAVNLGEKMRDGGCCMFGSSAAIAAAAESDTPVTASNDGPAEKPDPPASSGGAGSGALAVYVSQRRVGDMHTASQATAEATAEAAAPAMHSAAAAGGAPTLAVTVEDSFSGEANSILTETTNPPPPLAPANSTGSAAVSKTGEGPASAPLDADASGGGCGVPLRQLMTCMWGKENRPPPTYANRGASDSGTESDDGDSDSESDDGTFDILALAAASCPVDVDEDVFMIDTAEHLEAVHDIAASALRRGRFDRALAIFDKILESLLLRIEAGKGEGPCGGHRRLVGTTQHNMGIVHMWRGQYDLALKSLEDAVETRRECLQKDLKAHPAVAVSLAKKGLVLFALERHDEALLSLSEALEQRRRILSFDHLEMGKIHCAIGAVHYRRGDAISALKSFTSALEVQRLWLEGPVRREAIVFDASVTLANMGRIYVDRAECDMALYVYEEALLLQTTVFRKDHESVLTTLGNIAFAKARKGDHAKALQIYRGIYRSQVTKAGGPDSRRAAETMGLMAAMHLQLRHHGEAAVCLEALLDWQRRHVPGGDPALRNTETALKKLRRMLGEDEHELASTLSGSTADRSTF